MTLYVRKHDPLKCKEWKICCQDWTYVEIWFSEPSKNASQHMIIAISDGKIHVKMDNILVYIYVSSCQDEPCVSLFDRYCIHLFICSSIHQSWHRWPFRSPCQDWCLSFALAIPLPPPRSHTTPSLASHITHIHIHTLTPPAPCTSTRWTGLAISSSQNPLSTWQRWVISLAYHLLIKQINK